MIFNTWMICNTFINDFNQIIVRDGLLLEVIDGSWSSSHFPLNFLTINGLNNGRFTESESGKLESYSLYEKLRISTYGTFSNFIITKYSAKGFCPTAVLLILNCHDCAYVVVLRQCAADYRSCSAYFYLSIIDFGFHDYLIRGKFQ